MRRDTREPAASASFETDVRVTGQGPPRALMLTPSRGLGGGIERYVETLEWALSAQDIQYQRLDLDRAGPSAHARLLGRGRQLLGGSTIPTRLVLAHRALLPIGVLLAREQCVSGVSVVCHGSDVWTTRHRARRFIEDRLMRRTGVRVVAVSSFTSGALASCCPATILPPGLSEGWFQTLVNASAVPPESGRGVSLLTAFRLADWLSKGLPQLLDAVAALGRSDIHLTICGSGDPPPQLRTLVGRYRNCVIRTGLTDAELARELAAADLFVLATRTKPGRDASGEGFGLVLLEAQVAGTPVVAPAYGGSHDAFMDGVTGTAPADETAEALTTTLGEVLRDPRRLEQMGMRASEWARESFSPERYKARVAARLL
jgi:glycosyltransferase involved in cell wall biosynthesis